MKNKDKIFNNLVDHFIETKQLGHFDESNRLICLYDIENNTSVIKKIESDVNNFTTKYNLVILDKNDTYTNINILNIEI